MNEQDDFPLVSIITVTYNSSITIRDTLRSLAIQDYPNIEHIIVDGSSTDNTLDIIRSFPHVKQVYSEKDNGIFDAMNKGLRYANGKIIGILNSDDFYISETVISKIVNQLKANKADAVYADLIYVHPIHVDRILRTWIAGPYDVNRFLNGWMPPHPTFFARKEVYDKYGGFHSHLRFAADYELMLRFLYKYKIKATYLPQCIVKMRSGGHSNSSYKNRLKANKEDRESWRMNDMKPRFYTTWLKPLRKLTQFIYENKNNA
ncbi:MAG: glycosyltransferase family 2 protein [Saprospiraceae bacterium]